MSSALTTLAGVARERIAAWFDDPEPPPKLRCCAVHPGPFRTEELRRLSSATPAVYLALQATHGNEAGAGDGQRVVEAAYLASILTRPRGRESADVEAAAIGERLLRRIPLTLWTAADPSPQRALDPRLTAAGVLGMGGATQVRLTNEFSAELAEMNLALWTLTWRQTLRIGPAPEAGRFAPVLGPDGRLCARMAMPEGADPGPPVPLETGDAD